MKLAAAVIAALAIASSALQAGPGSVQVYTPVKTYAEAQALKPKTKIAVVCPSCGAMNVSTVGKDSSHLQAMHCGACKHSFTIESVAGGKATTGRLVCKDPTTGKTMPLQMCAEMH